MSNSSVSKSVLQPKQYYPYRRFSRKEVETIIMASAIMRSDYCRHYPEAEELARSYRDGLKSIQAQSREINAMPDEELLQRTNIAIAAGFYVLSPKVALYFMRINPVIFVDRIAEYMRNPEINWETITLQTCLMVTLMFHLAGHLTHKDHEDRVKELASNIPVPKALQEELAETTINQMSSYCFKRTLH